MGAIHEIIIALDSKRNKGEYPNANGRDTTFLRQMEFEYGEPWHLKGLVRGLRPGQ